MQFKFPKRFLRKIFRFGTKGVVCLFTAAWVGWLFSRYAPVKGWISTAFVLTQWGWESGWGGKDISTYFNPGNQFSCGCGSTCGKESDGKTPAFCSIRDGVNAYALLLTFGYSHVLEAYGVGGFSTAAKALGQGYYSGYTGGTVTYCGGPYTLTSPSGARIWAAGQYGSPAGQDLIDSLNAHSSLKALDTVSETSIPGFDLGC